MCGKVGALIPSQTVIYQVIDKYDIDWPREIFSLCMNPSCEMAYYSADYGYLFLQRQIKVELDYKEDVKNQYVCYCHKITYDDVKKKVNDNNIKNIRDYMKHHKPVIVQNCVKENPFGCSCLGDIGKIIEDHMYGPQE